MRDGFMDFLLILFAKHKIKYSVNIQRTPSRKMKFECMQSTSMQKKGHQRQKNTKLVSNSIQEKFLAQ